MISPFGLLLILSSLLGAEEWSVRAAASRALTLSYPASASVLSVLADDPRADPEARARARSILSACGHGRDRHEIQAEQALAELVRQTGYRDWPWVDSLPDGEPERQAVVQRYLGRARAAGFDSGEPYWSVYRMATAFLVRDRLAGGVSVGEAVLLLRRMVDGDHRQWERSGRVWAWVGRE